MSRRNLVRCVALAALALAGCRGGTSQEEPVAILRNMYSQPRYNAQSYSAYFSDKRTMRTPVEGTVPRDAELNPAIAEGRTGDGQGFVEAIPAAVVQRQGGMEPLLARGQARYGIYCAPCHDGTGGGKGLVIQRAANGGFQPPSFHNDRIRKMTDGQLYQVVKYGYNNMPAYGHNVPVDDRWAIVAYVRALQLSQAK
jgi:mono/diheme cytochrome c family protein